MNDVSLCWAPQSYVYASGWALFALHVCCHPLIMHLPGMRLEWVDPPPFSLRLSLQESDLKPQPREFQDQLTPLLYGLFMKHTLADGSVTVS